MQLIAADFDRRIDLPGVGPCPRPVDIDQSITGFKDLVSLRIYSFAPGATINGEAEGDEVFIVVLEGEANIKVTGPQDAEFVLSSSGGARAIYLPPDYHYQLTPGSAVDVAYARARSQGGRPPRDFAASATDAGVLASDSSHGEKLEFALVKVPAGNAFSAMSTAAEPLPERLVHIRAEDGASATEQGDKLVLNDWDTLALSTGEPADLVFASNGLALIVAARP